MRGQFKTAYIALDSELQRIQFMESWLRASGIEEWSRVPGIIVDELDCERLYDSRKRISRFGYPLSRSEVGCFLAHRQCWQIAVDLNREVLVLESDVKLCVPDKFAGLVSELQAVRSSWDLVRFHGIFEKNEIMNRMIKQFENDFGLMQSLGDPMGGGAYVVSPHGAAKLLRASEPFYQPVDVFLASHWIHRARFRSVKPYPFTIERFASSIGDRVRPKQTALQRLSIESHRFLDDIKRILYTPLNFLR